MNCLTIKLTTKQKLRHNKTRKCTEFPIKYKNNFLFFLLHYQYLNSESPNGKMINIELERIWKKASYCPDSYLEYLFL
jgi:hypothetical protein